MSADAAPGPALSWGPILEAHPLAHFVYDPDTLALLAVNGAALARYGYGREEFLSLRRSDLLLPGELEAMRLFIAGLPATTRDDPQRVWLERTRDGRVLHADVRGMPVLFEGRPARLAAVVDAGSRARLQADAAVALAESQSRLTAVLGAIPDLWFVIDDQMRYVEVSDPAHPALNAPWADKQGRPLEATVDSTLARAMREGIASAHASGQPQRHLYDMVVLGGAQRSFESRCVPLPDGRTLMLIRDITDVAQLEQRFRAMADAAPIGIFMTDPQARCTYTNPAWQALYGLDFQASLGRTWIEVVHPDDRTPLLQTLSRAAGAPCQAEFRLRLKDGRERAVAAHAGPILRADGSVSGHVGTVIDVTQARELQAERQARAVAEEAGRRQSAFMSRVSHELRTPLNAILGFGQLMQDIAAAPDERARSYAGHVVQAGRHMLALVDDLLQLQQLEQPRPPLRATQVDVPALLRNCAELLGPTAAAAGVRLEVAVPPGLVVHSEERCLRQVMLNLGSNALKYGHVAGSDTRVVLRAEPAADAVLFSVVDQGPGLRADQLQRLFQPFERLGQETGSQPGSGLGLVITRQLAHLLGGDVTLDSAPGRGTTATLRLPA